MTKREKKRKEKFVNNKFKFFFTCVALYVNGGIVYCIDSFNDAM